MKILRYGSIAAVVLLAAAMGFVSCAKGGKLASIRVTPADPTIAIGTNLQFDAVAVFSNGTAIDWTTAAVWSSSDATSVSMGNALGAFGVATSLATAITGTYTIMATDRANNISGTATLYITDPQSIAITPANPFMAVGATHQFTATATLLLSDLTTTTTQNITSFATWTTTGTAAATVSTPGLITAGTTTGTTSIMATAPTGTSDTTTLTVTDTPLESIEVTPNPAGPITIGLSQQFSATGHYAAGALPLNPDFTSSVIWSSSNTGVATISNAPGSSGLVTAGTTTGTTTIRATDPITGVSGPLGSVNLTVQ